MEKKRWVECESEFLHEWRRLNRHGNHVESINKRPFGWHPNGYPLLMRSTMKCWS
jgi:hypothetical protein